MTRPLLGRRLISLRSRLLVTTAVATAGVLLAAGLLLYLGVRAALLSEFDASLISSSTVLIGMIEQDDGRIVIDPEAPLLPQFSRAQEPDYFASWSDDERTIGGSTPTAVASLRTFSRPLPFGEIVVGSLQLPDGSPGRAVATRFRPAVEHDAHPGHDSKPAQPSAAGAMLVVARHTTDLNVRLQQFAVLLVSVGAVATGGATLLMRWVVVRGLMPLNQLANQIEQLGETELSGRVGLKDVLSEMKPIAERLNDLLDRLQAAVERERRFTADVAHELRTPLAGLAATLDVSASRARSSEEYVRTIGKCSEIVRGMHEMVESLFILARADARRFELTRLPVQIADMLQQSWEAFERPAAARNLRIDFEIAADLVASTDVSLLRMVFNNLFDNAASHANIGGWIRVVATTRGDHVAIQVLNSGATVSPADVRLVFDRFWRGDAARHDIGRHCGLGLSLCYQILSLLGGAIAAYVAEGEVFIVDVLVPKNR